MDRVPNPREICCAHYEILPTILFKEYLYYETAGFLAGRLVLYNPVWVSGQACVGGHWFDTKVSSHS